MNLKALKALTLSLSLVGLVGCGQGYTPSPEDNVATPHGGGDVFDANGDDTVYRTASYEVLRYTLREVLGLMDTLPPSTALCLGAVGGACPLANPVPYLALNATQMGAPAYTADDPLATQVPGPITSGGFKVWSLASSSACGRMMREQAAPALFPQGISNYDHMYNVLLGRAPTAGEVEILNNLQASITSFDAAKKPAGVTLDHVKGAAVCSAVLGSLEFLTVN